MYQGEDLCEACGNVATHEKDGFLLCHGCNPDYFGKPLIPTGEWWDSLPDKDKQEIISKFMGRGHAQGRKQVTSYDNLHPLFKDWLGHYYQGDFS